MGCHAGGYEQVLEVCKLVRVEVMVDVWGCIVIL